MKSHALNQHAAALATGLLIVHILVNGVPAAAATRTWNGLAGDGSWHTAGNWSGGAVPAGNDDIGIPAGYTVSVTARAPASSNVDGWGFGAGAVIDIASSGALYLGRTAGGEPVVNSTATINVNGGICNVSSYAKWSGLTVNVSGGGTFACSGGRDYNANQGNGTLAVTGSEASVTVRHHDINHWFDFHNGFTTKFIADAAGFSTITHLNNGVSRGLVIGSSAPLIVDFAALETSGEWVLIDGESGLGASETFAYTALNVPEGWTCTLEYDTANTDVVLKAEAPQPPRETVIIVR